MSPRRRTPRRARPSAARKIRPAAGLSNRLDRILAISPKVRYAAILAGGVLASREHGQLSGASSAESDKYEELIVNPTLLELVRRRGDIDCGGVRFLVVRYGNFFQAIVPWGDGHVSAAFETDADPPSIVFPLRALVDEWGRAKR